MSGVRQRIERQERRQLEDKLDYVPRTTQTTREQTVSATRVRDRLERTPDDEPVVRPPARAGLTGGLTGAIVRTRDRMSAEKAQIEIDNRPHPTPDMAAAGWQAMHEEELRWKREEAQRNADQIRRNEESVRAAARQREDQTRLATQQRDEQARQESEQRIERARMLPVDLILGNADAAEVARVKSIVARKFPADKYNPERHWSILMELRSLSTKPAWAGRLL